MTAIAAAFAVDSRPDEAGLRRMLDAAPHRGARSAATWSSGPALLGCRAWVGRNGVPQSPLAIGPGGDCIVFDGRLDNGDDLRRELGPDTPADDAALALAAYSKWSDESPAHLLGDFAFAIWDGGRRRLLCARDALGQRPLFYGSAGGATLVASEPQQLLAHPDFPAVVNEGMIAEYLTARPASVEQTIWAGITRLPPAHILIVSAAGTRQYRYWDFDPEARVEYARDEEYAEHFLDLFRTAVDCRTRGAAAVGIFLSGGLDSSGIAGVAAAMARERGAPSVRAFSTTFPGLPLDETPYIDAVVRKWDLPSVRMAGRAATREEMERDIDRFRDLPTYPNGSVSDPLRRRAAAEVDVALTGFGGDEWFTGSPLHTADLLREGRVLAAVRQYRHDVALPGRYTRAGLLRTAVSPILPDAARAVLRPLAGARRPSYDWIRPEFAARAGLADRLRWRRLQPHNTFAQGEMRMVAGCLLQLVGDEREDRATWDAGLDQRHPLNDRRLVEFGFALPEAQRWSGGETKVLLRRAFASVLPENVLRRSDKAEFSQTFVDALASLGGGAFFDRLQTADAGWIDGGVTRRMYDEMIALYRQGRESYIPMVFALWGIAAVELWLTHQHKERSR